MSATDWLAFYGAGLSTLLATLALLKSRRALTIRCVTAFNTDGALPSHAIRITLANRGSELVFPRIVFLSVRPRAVTFFSKVRFAVTYKRWPRRYGCFTLQLPDDTVFEPTFPCAIAPGRSAVIWVPVDTLDTLLRDIPRSSAVVGVQDELDRTLYGQRLPDKVKRLEGIVAPADF